MTHATTPSDDDRRPDAPVQRIEPAVIFVDESGHFKEPSRPGQEEWGVVGLMAMKDTDGNRAAVRAVVEGLRRSREPDAQGRRRVKAGTLTHEERERISTLIRERCVVGHSAQRMTPSHQRGCQLFLSNLVGDLPFVVGHLPPAQRVAMEPLIARHQLERAMTRRDLVPYLYQVFGILMDVASWFRAQGTFPRSRVFLDDKLPRRDAPLVEIFGAAMMLQAFTDVLDVPLRTVFGSPRRHFFDCTITSDDQKDGLVVADAIAHAASRVARGKDEDGAWAAFLDDMIRPPDPNPE